MTAPALPWPPRRAHTLSLLTGLYAAQGLPYGFFSLALPALLREVGWSLTAIGMLQFLALPWALKFLWAPVVDHHGARRHWLWGLQGAAVALALWCAWLDLGVHSLWLFVAVFLFNLVAATQDVVTDGLAVRLLDARDRGVANGIQVGAYRLGTILGGGLLLWVFARSNAALMFTCMAALLALLSVPVWRFPEPVSPQAQGATGVAAVARPGWRALALGWWHRAMSPGMRTLIGLIVAFRLGDQMASSLITPFILDQGAGKETLALMKGAVGSGTSLLGAALGAWLLWRVGRGQALLWSGLAQCAAFALYAAVALGWGGLPALWAATVMEGLLGTMATVALFALMMDAADPAHAGTDYTLLASVTVAVSGAGSLLGGAVGDLLGYAWAFGLGTVLSAGGCVLLVTWLSRHPTHARVAQAWR
ncbi:MFS transporter [Aquabacterium sp.]|uniref:MFS transporter n=1 Tax=Aquabacterium sp. TaxID=1872578 RepID=UPI0025BE15DD|nr:MFS transporter [Aquabacterium sp.]